MPRQTKEERLAEIHYEALSRFNKIQSVLKAERRQCSEDRRFYSIAGAQWEGGLEKQFANRPRMEINKLHLSVLRIINEYRNNRISVDFISKDGSDDKMSDICDGRFRSDERESCAQEAYDNGFEEACAGGIGAWRLCAASEDDYDKDNDHQRIRFEPIYDADTSVYFDLNSKRQDKSDAKYCFVVYNMTYEMFEEKFNEDASSWPKDDEFVYYDWNAPDYVHVAEYYLIEEVRRTVRIFRHLDGSEERWYADELSRKPETEHRLIAVGAQEQEPKFVRQDRCHKYLLSGSRILEDLGYVAGPNIPVIMMFGKRWYVSNTERAMGHVRMAKDVQRIINMQFSRLAEIAAYSPIEKPIFLAEQMAGHREKWVLDNVDNNAYLLINPVDDGTGIKKTIGPVGYTKPPQVPPAMAALMGMSNQLMLDLLGNQEAGEEIQPNISGKAIELIQNKLDMQSHIYMDNMKKAVKRTGEIWLGMAREIYVEDKRRLKILNRENETKNVELMELYTDEETGRQAYRNDFSTASFDVEVDVGPSSSSRRAAMVRQLIGLMQMTKDPEVTNILTSLALMNMEGEGMGEIQQFFRRKLIRMGVIKPNEEEKKELAQELAKLQQQRQNAEQEYLKALSLESIAKAEKSRADVELTAAKTEETRAKTAEKLSEMDRKQQDQTLKTMEAIRETQLSPLPSPGNRYAEIEESEAT